MFKTLIRLLAFILALQPVLATAQQFPLTMSANTVYGRLGIGPGPGQEIPNEVLARTLLGTLQQQIFPTLALAAAANIPAAVSIVTTLGRSAVGDNGGASYIRIAPSTAAAWRFRSADGQWWAINNRTITPEMFGCFGAGTTDCTNPFQQMATFLNGTGGAAGGYVINGTPGAVYSIWPQSAGAPSNLMLLTGINGLTWNFNGSRISTNNTFPSGAAGLFGCSHCTKITLNDPHYAETAWTALSNTAGAHFITIGETAAPWSDNIRINNLVQYGGSAGLTVAGDPVLGGYASNITVINAYFQNVFYGLNFQGSGDNFFARGIQGNYNGRLYFPWNVSHHDVELIGNGGTDTQVLFKVYPAPGMADDRRQLTDIKVRYRSVASLTPTAELSQLSFQQTVAPLTVSGAASNGSGKVRLTVNSTADMLTGQKWYFNLIGGTTEANGTFAVTVIDATHVDLASVSFVHAYTSGGYGRVPGAIKDISLGVTAANDGLHGMSVLATSKFTYNGVADTVPSGYEVSNVAISGSVTGFNDVAANAPLFSIFSSAWIGDTINNFALRNLVLSGTAGAISVTAPASTSTVNLENIVSDSGLVWSLGGTASGFNVVNVQANGVTDRNTVVPVTAPGSEFVYGIDANGGVLTRQPLLADLSGTLGCSQLPALTGDVTKPSGSCATTLATVNSNVGTFGSATSCVTVTNNAKGLTTAISAATCTPALGSITGFGTGVATALAINVGSAGAFVTNGGALGTPSSGTLTNATGLPTTGLTGALQAAQEPAHTGDVTNSAGSLALAIGATKVTSAMLNADVFSTAHSWSGGQSFTAPLLGTPASGIMTNVTGTASGLTAGNVTTNANLTGDVTSVGNATTLAAGNAGNLNSGTLLAARMPAMTGDCTTSAGAVATTCTKINGVDQTAAWTSYTPTITAGSGSPSVAGTASGRYKQIGKTAFAQIQAVLSSNVSGASGTLKATLPLTAAANGYTGTTYESSVTGKSGAAFITNGAPTLVQSTQADATTWWVNSYVVNIAVTYELP